MIDGLSYVPETELKKVKSLKVGTSKLFEIGESYFIRTVTYHFTGRVIDIAEGFVFMEDVAWIADSGRFTDFIKGEQPQSMESEIYGDKTVAVNISSIIDIVKRDVITVQK